MNGVYPVSRTLDLSEVQVESRTSTYHACSRHVKITLDGTEFRPGSNFLPQPLLFSTIIRHSVCPSSCLSAFNCSYVLCPCFLVLCEDHRQPSRIASFVTRTSEVTIRQDQTAIPSDRTTLGFQGERPPHQTTSHSPEGAFCLAPVPQ